MFKETLIPIRFVFLAYFCLSMPCLSKQETTWNYLIVNSFLCSPELSLSFPSWSLNSVLVGQGRIIVWSEEKPNFRLSWIEMYNFCMKQRKKCKLFQDRCEMLCSCLASYKADVGKLCNYCLGFFFLNWPYFGTFFSNTFWKEKPNFQTQRFCFFFPLAFPPWSTLSLTALKCSVLTFCYVDVGLSVLPETTEGIKTTSLELLVSP